MLEGPAFLRRRTFVVMSRVMCGRFAALIFFTIGILLAKAPTAAPDSADQRFAHAAQLAQQGNLAEAEVEYEAGLKLRPGDAQANNNLGVLYFQERKLRQATGAFERAHRLDPQNAEIDFNLGLALYQS